MNCLESMMPNWFIYRYRFALFRKYLNLAGVVELVLTRMNFILCRIITRCQFPTIFCINRISKILTCPTIFLVDGSAERKSSSDLFSLGVRLKFFSTRKTRYNSAKKKKSAITQLLSNTEWLWRTALTASLTCILLNSVPHCNVRLLISATVRLDVSVSAKASALWVFMDDTSHSLKNSSTEL